MGRADHYYGKMARHCENSVTIRQHFRPQIQAVLQVKSMYIQLLNEIIFTKLPRP